MYKIKSLNDLFLRELGDLYSSETQLVRVIPRLAAATMSLELKLALEKHLEKTTFHVNRLQEIFANLGHVPVKMTCQGMKGLIRECEDAVKSTEKSSARDAAIIGATQRVVHYEIAGYGTAENHASLLGYNRIQELLHETLQE